MGADQLIIYGQAGGTTVVNIKPPTEVRPAVCGASTGPAGGALEYGKLRAERSSDRIDQL